MIERNRWKVDELAFKQQDMIFRLSQYFPRSEEFNLTSQIRRASRSVGANLVEAYRKMNYPQHFILKLTDADAENSETGYCLSIAVNCKYCTESDIKGIRDINDQIGKLLGYMKKHPELFIHVKK